MLIRMGLWLLIALSIVHTISAAPQAVQNPDNPEKDAKKQALSNQDLVVEQAITDLVFNQDGTFRQENAARIRLQSSAAVQQFGVLTFSYQNAFDRVDTLDVRVRKPDGTVVVTPDTSVQDLAAEVARTAPTYSDAREKQVPVKSLGVGDVLEYRFVLSRVKPQAPGHFWYAYDFYKDRIVLDEVLRISVPSGKYVQVASPTLKHETREEQGRIVYTWKSSCATVPKPEEGGEELIRRHKPAVQLTTFHNWEEMGQWYGALLRSRSEVTPEIRTKAAELTAGLHTNLEKQRVLYQFVSTKFRYISISFGEGRFQPHTADEVLANQYGDCKDKHTIFAALLKAVGIEASAALIGYGVEFDPSLPSPGQFNHVITYLPQGGSIAWLDTTPEVAPYGMLVRLLRDQQALVIAPNETSTVMTTPAGLPFPSEETITVQSKLAANGTLTARFEIRTRGESEVVLRGAFHSAAPTRWKELAQNMAAGMGYGGAVTDVDVDNPANLESPFRFAFDYERKEYADWPSRRITVPLPPISLLSTEEKDKPRHPVPFGDPGKTIYRGSVELPEGYSVELPENARLQSPLADYSASYSLDKAVLTGERIFTIKAAKLSPDQWDQYCKFAKSVIADEVHFIQLIRSDSGLTSRVVRDVPQAAELVRKAAQAVASRDFNAARDALAQAERINPEQANLWMARAFLYSMQLQNEKAVEALAKEIEYHPGSEIAYRMKSSLEHQLGRRDAAMATLRQWVKLTPDNADAVSALTSELMDAKKYGEAVEPLRSALKADTDNLRLKLLLMEALIRGGRKTEGLEIIAKLRQTTMDGHTLNSVAWTLADTGTEPELARDLSAHANLLFEGQLKEVTLANLSREQLDLVDSLAATWDTLGWAYFQLGDLTKAEKYVNAAWILLENPVCGDHLGQIYERQERKAEAVRAYQLALAVKSDMPETKDRLAKLGGAPGDRPTLRRGTPQRRVSAEEELSQMRTTRLPELKLKGTAEFFFLFSAAGIEDVRFIHGDDALKSAVSAMRKAHYTHPFPDQGAERIPRRGILSCSEVTTPACSVVLLLPTNVSLN